MKNKIIFFLLSIFFISINNQAQDLDSLLTRGNKVFISSENKGVIKYSKEKIILWNYWKIAEDVNEADIILYLDAAFSGVYKISSYITSKDNQIIKRFRTEAWNNFWAGAKFNVKKGSVFGLFEREIIPYVHSLE